MAVWPEIGLAHGGGGGHAFGGPGGGHAFVGGGHEFGGFTDRGFSPNSGGGVHFLPVASLVAEITAALVTWFPWTRSRLSRFCWDSFDLVFYGFGYPDYYPCD